MFAGLALTYAAAHPALGAVTVDARPDVRPFAVLLRRLDPALRGDAFAETFHGVFEASMGLDLIRPPNARGRPRRSRIGQELVVGDWTELLTSEPEVVQARIDRLLEAIDVPVLAVFGREPEPTDRERLARIPDAACEVWPDHGHFVHLVEPNRFADRLLAFVEHCETTAAPAAAFPA